MHFSLLSLMRSRPLSVGRAAGGGSLPAAGEVLHEPVEALAPHAGSKNPGGHPAAPTTATGGRGGATPCDPPPLFRPTGRGNISLISAPRTGLRTPPGYRRSASYGGGHRAFPSGDDHPPQGAESTAGRDVCRRRGVRDPDRRIPLQSGPLMRRHLSGPRRKI